MHTQLTRRWVLLTGFAGCVGLATTAFAGEPPESMQRARASDVQDNALQPGESVHSMYLIKMLESSSQFRVRAQAAISLGLIETSPAARAALTAALRDEHPAVRAAAATSLGRIGGANHVSALRILADDQEGPVRNAARASIGRIESTIEESLEIAAAGAARPASTSAHHL